MADDGLWTPLSPAALVDLLPADWGSAPRRLLHGRGRTIDGAQWLSVDWFPPVLKLTLFRPMGTPSSTPGGAGWGLWRDELLRCLTDRLAHAGARAVLAQHRDGPRTQAEVLLGELPQPHHVRERDLVYEVRLGDQQNDGLFLDMAPVRDWLREHASGARVLNLFAYTCALGIAAGAGGASSVANLDMSRSALSWGQRNVALNDQYVGQCQMSFFPHNVFRSWWKLKQLAPFDLIVCDPPTRQRGSFDARKDYRTVMRRMESLLAPDGVLLACLNAPSLDRQFLLDAVAAGWPEGRFEQWLPGSADLPDASAESALKVGVFRRPRQ